MKPEQWHPQIPRSTRRARTTPEEAQLMGVYAYQSKLAHVLRERNGALVHAVTPQRVLQTDYPSQGAPLAGIDAINQLFARVYSATPHGVTRVAFSHDYAAVELSLRTKLSEGTTLPQSIVFDLEKNTYYVGTAKKDKPLIHKDAGLLGLRFSTDASQQPPIPLDVLSELTGLIGVVNNHERSTVVSEKSLVRKRAAVKRVKKVSHQ